MERRKRTRELIELGGLVQKSGLQDRVQDDRATMLGAFLTLVDELDGDGASEALVLWRRRGKRAFEMDVALKAKQDP